MLEQGNLMAKIDTAARDLAEAVVRLSVLEDKVISLRGKNDGLLLRRRKVK